jgi:quercetin dioxygenase-like cupin family protein
MRLRNLLFCAAACLFAATIVSAQDAVKVDPRHYKVETENSQVRVLRVQYGPHEKSVMHSHPATVVVYLTDGSTRFKAPDGKTRDIKGKRGETHYEPPQVHNPENIGDTAFEAIVIELKGVKPAATTMSSKK